MRVKHNNVYFLRQPRRNGMRSAVEFASAEHDSDPVVLQLSWRAKKNLQLLQLKFLDRRGREPNPSQIIEKLINEAAGSELAVPYPVD